MKISKEFLDSIKPVDYALGRSDKFSFNLWEFLESKALFDFRVLYDESAVEKFDGCSRSLLPNLTTIVIQEPWNNGIGWCTSLDIVITMGFGSKTVQRKFIPDNRAQDITEWFADEYLKCGRAIWDRDGTMDMFGDDNRWQYSRDGETRICNWSGAQQKKVHKMVPVSKWETVKEVSPDEKVADDQPLKWRIKKASIFNLDQLWEVVEAFHYTGEPGQVHDPVWFAEAVRSGVVHHDDLACAQDRRQLDLACWSLLKIKTAFGWKRCVPGMWIIRSGACAIDCCDDDFFRSNYDPEP